MEYQTTEQHPPTGHKPLGSLFADLYRETINIVRGEVRLAKEEMSEKVSQLETGAVSLVAAYVFSLLGVLILLESLVLALGLVMPLWLSALIVGVIVLIIGMALVSVARKKLTLQNMKPEATMESLRKDRDLMKEQTQ